MAAEDLKQMSTKTNPPEPDSGPHDALKAQIHKCDELTRKVSEWAYNTTLVPGGEGWT